MDEQTQKQAAPSEDEGRPTEVPEAEDDPMTRPAVIGKPRVDTYEAASFSGTLQSWTDKALHFLAHASNETLGACLAGLGATTYLVLGRVGLVVIGVAGGVVLHATWDGIRNDTRDEETKRRDNERKREAGIEVMKRVLEWRTGQKSGEQKEDVKVLANQTLDYSRFGPDTEKALNYFTDAVIKDYVYYWYGPTLPGEEAFPASCRRTFTAFMLSMSGHLERKRPANAFLDFVTNASSIIIVFLNELSAALNASPNSTPEAAISAYLELKPDSSLTYILDETSQNNKLADIAEEILQAYLDPKAYNCPPVYVFLKEVLTQMVLGYTVTLCSRPEWINEWIVYGLEDSETTKNVMDMVDAGVEGRATDGVPQKSRDLDHQSPVQRQEVISRKESAALPENPVSEHRRQPSKAEEAMDDAMREARRLTQMMMEEDERKAREEREKHAALSSSEDVSDLNTQGAPTPTSSESDRDRQDEEASAWGTESSIADAPTVSSETPVTPSMKQQFTSFDQLVSSSQPTALSDSPEKPRRETPQLTLHNATISIFDDSQPGEKASIKAKPQTDYLIQIEPSSGAFSGWMIARKYADFEVLHEVLRRISVITGVYGFTEAHAELPKWRVHTKASLRTELERYITDAVRFQPLAESEGMKRFLEKDQGLNKSPGANKSFGWPTPDAFGKFGGDMMNVLTKAPKTVAGGVAGGGKVVFGGVAGLVGGNAGGKKPSPSPTTLSRTTSSSFESHKPRPSVATLDSYTGSSASARLSQESLRAPGRPPSDRRASAETTDSGEHKNQSCQSPQRTSFESSRGSTRDSMPNTRSVPSDTALQAQDEEEIKLPPPPSEMPEDYASPTKASRMSTDTFRSTRTNPQSFEREEAPAQPPRPSRAERPPKQPISEGETAVAIELMFAVITELYTLSSVWNIRRTLLTAAKSFLLRPGNPQLASIRDLLQESMLDSNLSDSGIAGHIYKLRENALPTVEELEIWNRDYPEKTEEQKEELRVKARKLLVTKGMPQALSSVMGAAASGEALGKVFDCLQQPAVSRGLVFGLMRQALRVITH